MIRLDVDLTNPGQFFGCCGLFELAQRLWPRATAHFDGARLVVSDGDLKELVMKTARASLEVLEPANQTSSALRLAEPFDLRIDWWKFERGLKTWAGRMSVDRIATSLQRDLPNTLANDFFDDGHVIVGADGKKVEPYYFDGRRGATAELIALLSGIINNAEDHVLFVDVGPADRVNPRVVSLGKDFEAVTRQPIIV